MRTLEQALHDHELIVLWVIGEWWELELTGSAKGSCVKALDEKLSQLDMGQELQYMPAEDAAALNDLVAHGGRIPVPTFSRTHGEVRLMGPGRLEREEPWLDPISPAEALWYRGFLYKGFDETVEGMIEFYYLPKELLDQFPEQPGSSNEAAPEEPSLMPAEAPETFVPASISAVDDLTAILSEAQRHALQPGRVSWERCLLDPNPSRRSLLLTLAREIGMLRQTGDGWRPTRGAVKWLQLSREAQLRSLADAWSSSAWNELCHTPGLACEGEGWQNDPILARTTLLDTVPRSAEWLRAAELIERIKSSDPDFQRPDGNYDTWYIREVDSDEYVNGFEQWDRVEGRLLRYLLEGPGVWLGLIECSTDEEDLVFRLTDRALEWLGKEEPAADPVDVPLVVQPDATVLVPHNAGRYQRFQVARVSEAEEVQAGRPFRYRLTPRSLTLAQEQGIAPERVLKFLSEASGRPLPASVKRAITRFAEKGIEGLVEPMVVLRVRDAGILQTLRENPKTRDYIGETLGDLAVEVRASHWTELVSATAQLGLLLDGRAENDE